MNTTLVVPIFKTLADGHRMKMAELLAQNESTVGEIEKQLGLSQSATSQHLKLLSDAGLVSVRKHGNFRIYSLQTSVLQEAMNYFDRLWDDSLLQLKNNLENDEK
ncbi:MAG: metalloregulator ArsR/SmtB family transcription factor [Cyclobacteriaceae bacterium]